MVYTCREIQFGASGNTGNWVHHKNIYSTVRQVSEVCPSYLPLVMMVMVMMVEMGEEVCVCVCVYVCVSIF